MHTWENQFLHWNINIGHHLSGSYFTNKNPVAISPDAETVVIKNWTAKNTYKLWDTSKKRIWATLKGHEIPLYKTPNFVFSLDGKRLASANEHQGIGLIHVWNIPNQSRSFLKRLSFNSKTISPQYTLEGHRGVVRVIAFSPGGKTLASAGSGATIYLWDLETHSIRFTLIGHKKGIRKLAFSLDGKTLASTDYDVIHLWNVATGKQLRTSPTEIGVSSNALQFSPDGKTLIGGSWNGKIQLLDAHTLRLLSTHIGHTDWVNALMFSEDGKTLFSASRDGTILLWDWEEIVQVNN